MSIFSIIRTNRNSFIFLLLLIILPFIASSLIVFFAVNYENQIVGFGLGEWIMVYIVASITMALALTHTTFVALIGGFFLGWASIFYMLPAYILASSIGYKLANLIDKGTFIESIKSIPGVVPIVDNIKKKEVLIIFFSRISPVLPFAMMNALLSILKADFKKYLLFGSLGMLPRSLLFIWLGIQGRDIKNLLENPTGNLVSKLSFIVLMIISVFGLFYVFRNITKNIEKKNI